MNGWKTAGALLLLGLVVVGLPVTAHWLRRPTEPGCALDGARIDPAYRVEVVDASGEAHAFCCVRCAQMWLERQPAPPRTLTVTDEVSGTPVAAASAWYVRSAVVTVPATGARIHVFRDRADAEKHAAQFSGTLLSAAERPFP